MKSLRIAATALCSSLFFSALCTAPAARAEHPDDLTEIVISPNRGPRPLSEVASSVSVITGEEIEEKKQQTVQDALEGLPGVDLVRSGGLGGNLAIFLRGANPEHTLVLIDGVEVNDPIVTARVANISNISTDNIERIEVVRGPQSVLYGSDALGGVISITTKRGEGAPSLFVSTEGGSYSTFTERVASSGSGDDYYYSVAGSRVDSDSISQAGAKYGNSEHDGYDDTSVSTKVGLLLPDKGELNLMLRNHVAHSDIDNSGGVGGDDPNRFFTSKQFFSRAEGIFHAIADNFEQKVGVSYADQEFTDSNTPDNLNPLDTLESEFRSHFIKVDLLNSVSIGKQRILVGVETENEEGSSDTTGSSAFGPFESVFHGQDARTDAAFAQFEYAALDRLFGTVGVRVDHHDQFGTEVTWRAAPVVRFDETGTKLSASVGTGFRAPSLFQLYSEFGSTDLEAEESLGFDAGVTQQIVDEQLEVSCTYFRNNFDNLITFEPSTFLYRNVTEAKTEGLEFEVRSKVNEQFSVAAQYTLTNTKDEDTGSELLRRAKNKVGLELRYLPVDNTTVRVGGYYVGKRTDTDFSTFPAANVELGGYVIVNAAVNHQLTEKVQLFAKVENLLDREYEEVLGFGAPGVGAYAGVKVDL